MRIREIREAAVRALRDGRGNQYPPGPGVPELRAAIVEHQRRRYGLRFDPDTEVLVTAGATEAIAAALLGLLEPGDEVIALEPYYDSYAACIAMAGGTRVPVTLRPSEGPSEGSGDAGGDRRFRLDLDELRDAVTDRTRLLLINTPHNPTGTVLTREELTAIAELAVERDLLVVTDEVYEHLVFDDAEHLPLASFPGMRERMRHGSSHSALTLMVLSASVLSASSVATSSAIVSLRSLRTSLCLSCLA